MRLLVDADFLISLIKEDDRNHLLSLRKLENLKTATVFVTPFTIPETATVLSYKVSQQAAKKFLKEARNEFSKLSLEENILESADSIFLSQQRKGISWIDCLNVAVIRHYKLDGILSYDRFYGKLGVRVW